MRACSLCTSHFSLTVSWISFLNSGLRASSFFFIVIFHFMLIRCLDFWFRHYGRHVYKFITWSIELAKKSLVDLLAVHSFKFAGLGCQLVHQKAKHLEHDISCYIEALCPSESWNRNLLFEGCFCSFHKTTVEDIVHCHSVSFMPRSVSSRKSSDAEMTSLVPVVWQWKK